MQIQVSPTPAKLAIGAELSLVATGIYGFGAVTDITILVTWLGFGLGKHRGASS